MEVIAPVVSVKKQRKEESHRVKQMCEALYDYQANDNDELSFVKGDVIAIVEDRPEWLVVRTYLPP